LDIIDGKLGAQVILQVRGILPAQYGAHTITFTPSLTSLETGVDDGCMAPPVDHDATCVVRGKEGKEPGRNQA
jgi:hypothetical protein